jgi:hypothetical protein
MRGKLAKQLRKQAGILGAEYPFVPTKTSYVAKNYTRYAPGFNAHGEPEMKEVKKVTIMLGNCTRKIYQQLKRGYK